MSEDLIYSKFNDCVLRNSLFGKDDNILAAVSGGADSVCMLLMLDAFVRKSDGSGKLYAAHVNHCIRGEEADRDEAFVAELCHKLGVAFVTERIDIPAIAREERRGIEETARKYRYDFLKRKAKELCAYIAVAHNCNDKAETVLMNIMRGTSTDGLRSIVYKNGDIVRPILDLSRHETEMFCKSQGVTPMVDSTNLSDSCTRNRVRLNIIPFLSEQLGHDVTEQLLNLSRLADVDCSYIDRQARQLYEQAASVRGGVTGDDGPQRIILSKELFCKADMALQSRVVRMCIADTIDSEGNKRFPFAIDLSADMTIRVCRHIMEATSGKMIEIGRDVRCRIEHNEAVFYVEQDNVESGKGTNSLRNLQRTQRPFYEIRSIKDFDAEEIAKPKDGAYELFDSDELRRICDEIAETPVFRTPQEGDIFTAFGAPGSKPLRRFLIDRKVPLSERRSLRVLAVGNMVLWIPSLQRRCSQCAVSDRTTEVIIFRSEDCIS